LAFRFALARQDKEKLSEARKKRLVGVQSFFPIFSPNFRPDLAALTSYNISSTINESPSYNSAAGASPQLN